MTPLETALGGAVTALVGAVTWLTMKLLAVLKERDALHEAQKTEMRENAKAILALLEKVLAAIDRVCDLEEHRHQS